MEHISNSIHETLVAQGIANGRAGTRASGGIGAGDQSGGTDRLLTAQPEGGRREPMGMGKNAGAEAPAVNRGGHARFGRSRSPVLEVHTNPNMPNTSMRKRAKTTPFLMVVK